MTNGVSRWLVGVGQVVIVLAMIVVLAVLPARVIMQPWIIYFEYGHLAPDTYGMNPAERTRLALDGVDSIIGPQGMDALRQGRFDSGEPAFTEREISHMQDVRTVAGHLFNAQGVAFVVLMIAAIGLARDRRTLPALASALRAGAAATLITVLGVGVFAATSFNTFFTLFHRIFFTGNTWLFLYTDTLIRLYPVQFWIDVTVMICVGIVLETVALGGAAWWWLRRLYSTLH